MSDAIGNAEFLSRLEKVERENRFLKSGVALLLLMVGAVLLMAQAPGRLSTIEAGRLVIRYPNGREAIVFGTSKEPVEESIADFYSPRGVLESRVSANADGGAVHVYSSDLKNQMNMVATKDWADFAILHPPGDSLVLTNGPLGASVQLWANLTAVRAVLGKTNLENVRSGEGRSLSSLVLFDKEGKVVWKAP